MLEDTIDSPVGLEIVSPIVGAGEVVGEVMRPVYDTDTIDIAAAGLESSFPQDAPPLYGRIDCPNVVRTEGRDVP